MIYRTSREKIDAYFESTAVSQSELKLLGKGIDYYLNNEVKIKEEKYFDEPAEHFKIGSAVDCKITEGDDVFNKLYYISTLEKMPSDAMVSIVRQVYDAAHRLETPFEPIIDLYRELIIAACVAENYQPRWGEDAKVNAVKREGEAYWLEIANAGDRTILTIEEKVLIDRVVDSIKLHPEFANYYKRAEEGDGIDILFQFPLYFGFQEMNCKALLDIVIIDHPHRLIIPWDIKTLWDTVANFPSQSNKRRYDIQGSFYHNALVRLKNRLTNSIVNNYDIEDYPSVRDYQVDGFSFLVQSTTFNNNAVLFKMESSLLEMGKNGRSEMMMMAVEADTDEADVSYIKTKEVKGYTNLISEIRQFKQAPETKSKHPDIMSFDWYGRT